jgi:hypothetical protein
MLAASHGYEDAYPTIVTLMELRDGTMSAEQLKNYRENGNPTVYITLTTDAESVYKSLTSRDLKTPAEKTLLGHVCWLRELLLKKNIRELQWCDTRDMLADGHTKGSIDRAMLINGMRGIHFYRHPVKRYEPYRGDSEKS